MTEGEIARFVRMIKHKDARLSVAKERGELYIATGETVPLSDADWCAIMGCFVKPWSPEE